MNLARSTFDSPVGPLTLVASERGLSGVLWQNEKLPKATATGPKRHAVLGKAARQLQEYFAGTRKTFDLPLDPQGSDFELRVWLGLRTIGYGATLSYGALAKALGSPKSSRAVGGATGRNPIAIIVPCHRLIGSDGRLTGFAGGIGVKKWLLDFESGAVSKSPKVYL